MYIRLEGNEYVLVRTVQGLDGSPRELILAGLGQDPELNLFVAAEMGRRKNSDLWEGVRDFDLLQALENFKRRLGRSKAALVTINGGRKSTDGDQGDETY
ncbi:MAG: hypothetical protein AB1473_17745 [Thermodesulfobacteriota bacterium]